MTIVLLTALISVILAFFFYKQIHKYKYILYGFFGLLALVVSESGNIITLGFVPFGIFLVVMYTGVLDKGIVRKRLALVRAEYAIIGSILLLPHAIGYLEIYLDEVFPKLAGWSQLFGVLAFLTMIPLFVTSFQFIRKKFSYKEWKSLHKVAYVSYLFIFAHLLILNNDRFFYYLAITVVYIALKVPTVYKWIEKRKKT
jgi:sulfoxide reductase heme-binding subunit YedZ